MVSMKRVAVTRARIAVMIVAKYRTRDRESREDHGLRSVDGSADPTMELGKVDGASKAAHRLALLIEHRASERRAVISSYSVICV